MADETDDVTEVVATPIDPPELLGEARRWLADARLRVATVAGEYGARPVDRPGEYQQEKRERSALRKEIAAIEDERRGMTRSVKEAIKVFEAGARDVLAPLVAIDGEYKDALDEWDRKCDALRRERLGEAYAEYAPDLVPLVPFDRLSEKFSKEGKWYLRSTDEGKALMSLRSCVAAVAKGEQTIASLDWLTDEERADLKAEYFSTLDLSQSLRSAQQRAEQRRRVDELEQARAAREAAVAAPQPEPEPQPVTEQPEATAAPAPAALTAPEGDGRREYRFILRLNDDELGQFMAALRELGLHGRRERV